MTGGLREDRKESFQEIVMSKKSKRPRRSFSDEFKQDAVDLVVKQNYSFKAAVVQGNRMNYEQIQGIPEILTRTLISSCRRLLAGWDCGWF